MPRRKMSVTQLTLLTSLSMMGAGIIMLPAKFAEDERDCISIVDEKSAGFAKRILCKAAQSSHSF